MKKKVLILTMLVAIMVFGCSRANSNFDDEYSKTSYYGGVMPMRVMMESADMSFNDAAVMHDRMRREDSGGSEAAFLNNDERKLIKRAYIRIRVENLVAADASLSDLMSKYGAYSASTEAEENSRNYSLRVPAPQYENFLAEMDGMGRLIRRSESTDDVTLHYYDLEGRLEMKRALLRTFQSYLTRARTIEEILSVEARIAELQYDIEGTGVQLRHLTNRIEYATIDLNLLGPVTATQNKNQTLAERISQLFGNFGNFLSTILVIFLGFIIFGVPIIIVILALFWVLFGRIGLMRKLWGLIGNRKT